MVEVDPAFPHRLWVTLRNLIHHVYKTGNIYGAAKLLFGTVYWVRVESGLGIVGQRARVRERILESKFC